LKKSTQKGTMKITPNLKTGIANTYKAAHYNYFMKERG